MIEKNNTSLAKNLSLPGEHPFLIQGLVGLIEGVLTVPVEASPKWLAVLGHPHSLQGGTMNNKVVTTLVRTFNVLKIPSLRFNFRGVGASEGMYDAGVGESEDMLFLVKQCLLDSSDRQIIFAGFSYGSYVAYRAAAQLPNLLLITIAPPVHHYDYKVFPYTSPWLIVLAEEDDIVPAEILKQFVEKEKSPISLLSFVDTGHFFHGQLITLKQRLLEQIEYAIRTTI